MLNATGKIIIIVPEGFFPGRGRPQRPQAPQQQPATVAREQRKAEVLVDDVREYFTKLGVGAGEGNGAGSVTFDPNFDNAAYIPPGGERHGPGDRLHIGVDPETGKSYASSSDVIAHEWSHRIIDTISNHSLDLSKFSSDAAIHESLADTFAAAYDGDWTLGEDMGKPVRDMANPERLGDPGHEDDIMKLARQGSPLIKLDRGSDGRDKLRVEAHAMAGIPNKAASILGEAVGMEKLGKIYLKTLRDNLQPGAGLTGYAQGVLTSTAQLFGAKSPEFTAATQAWDAVGLLDNVEARMGKSSAPRR